MWVAGARLRRRRVCMGRRRARRQMWACIYLYVYRHVREGVLQCVCDVGAAVSGGSVSGGWTAARLWLCVRVEGTAVSSGAGAGVGGDRRRCVFGCEVAGDLESPAAAVAAGGTYNILIEGLCKEKKLGMAKNLFDQLPSKGLQPDVITYTILIGALCKEGQIEEAKELLMKMEKSGCLPNSTTYNVLIQGLLKRNAWHNVISILEDMERRGFLLHATTFSLLLDQLQVEGHGSLLFNKVKKLIPKNQ